MSEDLASVELAIEQAPEIMVPLLGELVDLREPDQVAAALEAIRAAKRILDEARGLLEAALRLEAQRQGTKTLHLGNVDAVVSGGETVSYDCERLQEALRAAGLPEERLAQVVVETVSYKVDQRVARQLAAANPAYAEALEACRIVAPAPWRVSIRRA